MSIVVIGAGLAGATAVTELRAQGYAGQLTAKVERVERLLAH